MTAREEFESCLFGRKWESMSQPRNRATIGKLLNAVEREARNTAYEKAMQIIDYMKCGANENDHASDIAHDKICDSAIKEIRALKATP